VDVTRKLLHKVESLSSKEELKKYVNQVAYTDGAGVTALHICAKNECSAEIAKLLLDYGADVNHTGDPMHPRHLKRTPLHWAAQLGNMDMIKLLIDHGANKDAQDVDGNTPLHLAARNVKINAIKYLLENGAQYNSVNLDSKTAEELATDERKHLSVDAIRQYLQEQPTKMSMCAKVEPLGPSWKKKRRMSPSVEESAPKRLHDSVLHLKQYIPLATNQTTSCHDFFHNPDCVIAEGNMLTPPNSDQSAYSTTPSPILNPSTPQMPAIGWDDNLQIAPAYATSQSQLCYAPPSQQVYDSRMAFNPYAYYQQYHSPY
jgi:hypothetical protein